MSKEDIVDKILIDFYSNNVKWRIGGKLVEPTREDIESTLDSLAKVVYDGDNNEASTGRILVQKLGEHTDVYLYIGELHD